MKHFIVLTTALFSIFLFGSKPLFEEGPDEFKTKETIELSGIMRAGMYLSRMEGDDKEYFNNSYHLNLKTSINVLDVDPQDADKDAQLYEDISHIEIPDSFLPGIDKLFGKEVIIKGSLGIFRTSSNGYYRQYSNPVYINVLSVKLVE